MNFHTQYWWWESTNDREIFSTQVVSKFRSWTKYFSPASIDHLHWVVLRTLGNSANNFAWQLTHSMASLLRQAQPRRAHSMAEMGSGLPNQRESYEWSVWRENNNNNNELLRKSSNDLDIHPRFYDWHFVTGRDEECVTENLSACSVCYFI